MTPTVILGKVSSVTVTPVRGPIRTLKIVHYYYPDNTRDNIPGERLDIGNAVSPPSRTNQIITIFKTFLKYTVETLCFLQVPVLCVRTTKHGQVDESLKFRKLSHVHFLWCSEVEVVGLSLHRANTSMLPMSEQSRL